MQTFGDYLKEQREAKNISLKEVAILTNVTERYLDFIEKDDFEKVPEGPYIRGYISLYAKAIGINPQEVVHRFDSQCRERNKTEDLQQEISEQKVSGKFMAVLNNLSNAELHVAKKIIEKKTTNQKNSGIYEKRAEYIPREIEKYPRRNDGQSV